MNEVFFLGAGFSKYLNKDYPLLVDLTNEFMPKDKNFDDIEQYLTYLVSKLPFKDEVTIYSNLAEYKELTEKIAGYFWGFNEKENPKLNDKQKQIFQTILDRKIPCITMNYDLLLENILLDISYNMQVRKTNKNGEKYRKYDFKHIYEETISIFMSSSQLVEEISEYDMDCMFNEIFLNENVKKEIEIKFPKILKLHGSINWYYHGVSANDIIYLFDETKNFEGSLSNFIIPPTLDKQSLYNHTAITHLWRQAHEQIQNAEKIYIFGYSFPKSDISVDTLFRSALANNPNNYKIYIFGNSENENPRYKEIFKDKYEYSYGNDKNTEKLLEIFNNK